MRKKPVITVFMAVYNGNRYLEQAINSVLSQTFSDFEFLIINDGSTDNSWEIISRYKDPRIRLLNNEENRGLIFTRNRGVQEALGEYFAILDCDDIAVSNRLEIQNSFFIKNPDLALCSGRALNIDSQGRTISESPVINGDRNVGLIFGNFLINSAVMIKTDIIKVVGSYNANDPAEDYDLAMRISQSYPIEMMDDILVKYRIHENNISLSNIGRLQKVEKNILRDFHSRFKIHSNERIVDLHHSFLTGKMDDFELFEYKSFLEGFFNNAKVLERYNHHALRKLLFNKWVQVLVLKGGRNSFLLLFKSHLYHYSVLSFKHLRRVFKKTVREFVSSML